MRNDEMKALFRHAWAKPKKVRVAQLPRGAGASSSPAQPHDMCNVQMTVTFEAPLAVVQLKFCIPAL